MRLFSPLAQLHRRRPRLMAAALAGLVVFFALQPQKSVPARFLIAWDCGVFVFLALVLAMVARATPKSIRYRAQLEDEKAWVILALTVGAALASMVAIGFVLHAAKDLHGSAEIVHVSLSALTILLSWCMTHTMFALHFAHAYYGDWHGIAAKAGLVKASLAKGGGGGSGGLAFPGEERPDYWDFLYFSFIIGMTCQVSDVQVTSRPMRRLALGHGLIAFIFNTVVLALSINLLAGLL